MSVGILQTIKIIVGYKKGCCKKTEMFILRQKKFQILILFFYLVSIYINLKVRLYKGILWLLCNA